MIYILIVDDETPSRKQIKNELLRLGYQEEQLVEATNGNEALKLASKTRFDILLTDISMPKMLGTDLAQSILRDYPKCKLIFFSGYSDKEYLRAAIKMNVIDYLEKPVDFGELTAAVKKAEAEIRRENDNVLKEQKSSQLLEYVFKNKSEKDIEIKAGSDNILKYSYYTVAMVKDYSEKPTFLTGHIEELCRKTPMKVVGRYRSNGIWEFLFASNQLNIVQEVRHVFDNFFQIYGPDVVFKCAVGSFSRGVREIYSSYENAVFALDNAFFHPSNTVVIYAIPDMKTIDSNKLAVDLHEALLSENHKRIKELANYLFWQLYESNFTLSDNAKKIYYELFEVIHKFCEKYVSSYNEKYSLYDSAYSIYEARFISDLNDQLILLIGKMETLLKNTSYNDIVKSAIGFIERDYSNAALSIVDIAQHCNVNANYLCSVFKDSTGMTINNYVNNYRIENAKKLLIKTNDRLADIAMKCGFADTKYFYKVFKKCTSYTPSNFRKMRK